MEITLDTNLSIEDLLGMLYRGGTKQTCLNYKEIQTELKYQERNTLTVSLVWHPMLILIDCSNMYCCQ